MNTIAEFTALCRVAPEIACRRILSAEGLKHWWLGSVEIEHQDAQWPENGTRLSFKAGGGRFTTRIAEDERPHRVLMTAETPSGRSRILQIFEALPDGGTRYTKRVYDVEFRGFYKFLGPVFTPMLKNFVKKEVLKAVQFADTESAGASGA